MGRVVLAGAALGVLALSVPARAQAVVFTPCADAASQQCATVTVPLDRSGVLPGTVPLALRRIVNGAAGAHGALLVLAGGPGQAANSLIGQIEGDLGSALGAASLDLVTFDQRGTGRSGRIDCSAIDSGADLSPPEIAASCSAQLGAARSLYTTSTSIDDIESIRQALGVDRLTLYGASYGTKVALAYAVRYPQHVQALILDSVVGLDAPDPLQRSTLRAVPRVLADACALGCGAITHDPAGDVARLSTRLVGHSLRGSLTLPDGHSVRATVSDDDLIGLLKQGDFDPSLRADLPASVRAALRGDAAPLLRLLARGAATGGAADGEPSDDNNTVLIDTSCEELAFPWSRATNPQARFGQLLGALAAQPAGAFGLFPAGALLDDNLLAQCLFWPPDAAPQSLAGPLPDVPVLTLSGYDDLRTPLEDARAVAALFPHATVVAAGGTGHAVLANDTPCAAPAIADLLAGRPAVPASCATVALRVRPAAAIPGPLSTLAAIGATGRAGRTARAVLLTVQDALRQATFLGSGVFGGLRGGTLAAAKARILLHRYAYVTGVAVSGTISVGGARVTVAGAHVAGGRLVLSGGRLSGTLGGHHLAARFRLPDPLVLAGGRARAAGAALAARPAGGPLLARGAIAIDRLDAIVGGY